MRVFFSLRRSENSKCFAEAARTLCLSQVMMFAFLAAGLPNLCFPGVATAQQANPASPAVVEAAPAAPSNASSRTNVLIWGTIQFLIIGVFVYYLLVILPKNAEEAEHKKFIEGLKKNDEVLTRGGLLGRVVSVSEEAVTLDLGSTKVRVLPKYLKPFAKKESAAATKPAQGMSVIGAK